MKSVDVACVFAEPQTNSGLIGAVVEGTGARVGTLDPEAIALAPGPDLYFSHLRSLAADLTRCLATPV
jgi:zinc transport system substrate-binding protein